MNAPCDQPRRGNVGLRCLLAAGLAGAALGLVLVVVRAVAPEDRPRRPTPAPRAGPFDYPRELDSGRRLSVWWDVFPEDVTRRTVATGTRSNIHPADYAGPDSCKECHEKNHDAWSRL